ncbi:hypothetical protein MMIN_17200 [Mycolicibacter minnesotensis]|nr:hypothetical protein MMIN_17200 [Mycolicibacter minnesotensis]
MEIAQGHRTGGRADAFLVLGARHLTLTQRAVEDPAHIVAVAVFGSGACGLPCRHGDDSKRTVRDNVPESAG